MSALQELLCLLGLHNWGMAFYEKVESQWPDRILVKRCTECSKYEVDPKPKTKVSFE